MSTSSPRLHGSSHWSKLAQLFVLTALAAGCGGDAPMTQAQFCTEKATRECQGVAANCSVTPAACNAARVSACMAFIAAQVPAETRPFRPERAPECLNATATAHMKPRITPADRQLVEEACQRVFSGSKATGATCASSLECDGTLICDRGFCTTRTVVAPNAFCNNPGDVCPGNQTCVLSDDTRRCMVPSVVAGQACDDVTNPCSPTLRCEQGQCTARVPPQGQCTRDADCEAAAPYCDPYFGNTCNTGFIPAPGAPECAEFGATLASF